MDEEDDSGYEAQSIVTTNCSIKSSKLENKSNFFSHNFDKYNICDKFNNCKSSHQKNFFLKNFCYNYTTKNRENCVLLTSKNFKSNSTMSNNRSFDYEQDWSEGEQEENINIYVDNEPESSLRIFNFRYISTNQVNDEDLCQSRSLLNSPSTNCLSSSSPISLSSNLSSNFSNLSNLSVSTSNLISTPPLETTINKTEEIKPISEEEFTSRKTALRQRINNTFRILNNINNNCDRFRTITSRSQELLNQRRLAELELDSMVQNSDSFLSQPRIERDLKKTIDSANQEAGVLNASTINSNSKKPFSLVNKYKDISSLKDQFNNESFKDSASLNQLGIPYLEPSKPHSTNQLLLTNNNKASELTDNDKLIENKFYEKILEEACQKESSNQDNISKENFSNKSCDSKIFSSFLNTSPVKQIKKNVNAEPKLINTEIDCKIMDQLLAKSKVSKRDSQSQTSPNLIQPLTENQKVLEKNQNKNFDSSIENSKKFKSKYCQTNQILNQDISVSVIETDLQNFNFSNDSVKKIIEENKNSQKNCFFHSKNKTKCFCICKNEELNAIRECPQCVPFCINTFNNNYNSYLKQNRNHNVVDIGINTEDEPKIISPLKRDQETQCFLGLSLEEQQKEYIEQQQQKFLKLKKENTKLDEHNKNEELKINIKSLEVKKKETSDEKNISKTKDNVKNNIETENIRLRTDETKKLDLINLEKNNDTKNKVFDYEKNRKEFLKKIKKDENVNFASSSEKEMLSKKNSDLEVEKFLKEKKSSFEIDLQDHIKDTIKPIEILNKSAGFVSENEKNFSEDNFDTTEVAKIPTKLETNQLINKLNEGKKKNVKTHSKIVIEFTGKSNREISAIDSITNLDENGKMTKKTLVSNTKEIPIATNEKTENSNQVIKSYPLSSTPEITSNLIENDQNENEFSDLNSFHFYKNTENFNKKWKEASYSEIKNEISAEPLLDDNNKVLPTRSVALSTVTSFNKTSSKKPQKIEHKNKYKRIFENPKIHEPVIESHLSMLEGHSSTSETNLSSSSLLNTSIESLIGNTNENNLVNKNIELKFIKLEPNLEDSKNVSDILNSKNDGSKNQKTKTDIKKNEDKTIKKEDTDFLLNSRSGSRVSFNLPQNSENVKETDLKSFNYKKNFEVSQESNLDETDLNIEKKNCIRNQNEGFLETELDENICEINKNEKIKEKNKEIKLKKRLKCKSKDNERKKISSNSNQNLLNNISDQCSTATINSQKTHLSRSTPKLNDSGFLSPEMYHNSPYDFAYNQSIKKVKKPKEKQTKSCNSLKQLNGESDKNLEKSSRNTEIITCLTKKSYPCKKNDLNLNDSSDTILKTSKRNKMVFDQTLNSPDIKPCKAKKSSKKNYKTGCKLNSKIIMDLPINENNSRSLSNKEKNYPLNFKTISLEDLDRKSIISQHSYSQQSGEFVTSTKFERSKPSRRKNNSSVQLNQEPDETNWEYTMQCNCINGSKANVLTNVKHRRLLYFPLTQYETSL